MARLEMPLFTGASITVGRTFDGAAFDDPLQNLSEPGTAVTFTDSIRHRMECPTEIAKSTKICLTSSLPFVKS
jgi:hypothetical protein